MDVRQEAILVAMTRTAFANLQGLYIFGSQADGTATGASDIDLAILVALKPSADAVIALKSEISQHFKVDCDLIDLRRADSVTAAQVVAYGKLLFSGDESLTAHFETMVLSRYAFFNEERSQILDEIKKTGKIYG